MNRDGDLMRPLSGDDPARIAARAALADLRREIRGRFTRAPVPVRSAVPRVSLPAAWERGFDQLRERLATFGMHERSAEIDEFGMDAEALRALRPLLDFVFDRFWRVRVGGIDGLPERGPYLLVANAAGILPYDALMIAHAVERARGERPRFAVADWLITLPFVQPRLARLGGVRACRENVERLLEARCSVAVFPEGVKGAAKPFRDRYRLARFGRGGVVRLAVECGVPIVPVGVVGAEEAHPILYKMAAPARALGLPFVPVTPTFPWFGPLGALPLPSQWVIRFGEPISYADLAPDAARDALLLSRLTEELRAQIQSLVDAGLRTRATVWSLAPGQASAGAPSERTG
ncbi:MAG TPA: 1-acyl-sn-glycerol-3-phosphate acyltransferase [Myxococcota bacterium]|nr:1-acyl-sn-glycerol-3-phosphate acyltransferase [Myxococcota bacterium]